MQAQRFKPERHPRHTHILSRNVQSLGDPRFQSQRQSWKLHQILSGRCFRDDHNEFGGSLCDLDWGESGGGGGGGGGGCGSVEDEKKGFAD